MFKYYEYDEALNAISSGDSAFKTSGFAKMPAGDHDPARYLRQLIVTQEQVKAAEKSKIKKAVKTDQIA